MNRPLIKYAGFDPNENDFSDIKMAPVEHVVHIERSKRPRHRPAEIDFDRAVELRKKKMTYKRIGEILAEERGRATPFKDESIRNAMRRQRAEARKLEAENGNMAS